jgi:hypothetical protein
MRKSRVVKIRRLKSRVATYHIKSLNLIHQMDDGLHTELIDSAIVDTEEDAADFEFE